MNIIHPDSKNYDIIVIGAGFAGAVFARIMADSGKRILIVEKRPYIGGNMYTYDADNIIVHKYGPHIFHTNSTRTFEFINRFSEWYKYEHHVVGSIDGKYIPIPFNFTSIDMLFDANIAINLKSKLTKNFGADKRIIVFDLLNHHDLDLKELGQFIYEKIFVNYSVKQWGVHIDKIDISTINRLPIVLGYDNRYFSDSIQAMPKNGFTQIFSEMLKHKNINLILNTNAREKLQLDLDKRKIFFENNEFEGIVFYTCAVDELLDYKYGKLPYRSLDLIFESVNAEMYQPNPVVNYPNDEEFTRITEFKHFMLPNNIKKQNKTIILKEYPLQYDSEKMQEPYYPIINDANINIYNNYLTALNDLKNLYLCGRLAEYKYYNMDTVIERALNIAEEIMVKKFSANKYNLFRQVILYGIIGSICAGIDGLLFLLLRYFNLNLYFSNFISINLGILLSFLLNSIFNFKKTNKFLHRACKFLAVGYSGLLISMLLMYLGVKVLNHNEIIIKLLAIFLAAIYQFTVNKFFTFRK
jgi:UDP-galactopyranose mutase